MSLPTSELLRPTSKFHLASCPQGLTCKRTNGGLRGHACLGMPGARAWCPGPLPLGPRHGEVKVEAGVNHRKAMLHRCSETVRRWEPSPRWATGLAGPCTSQVPRVQTQNTLGLAPSERRLRAGFHISEALCFHNGCVSELRPL